MTTYIQKKERVFRERGDIQSERSRNVGEMKRIGSCIDRRAWATSDEERRQHILEYTKAKASFGTYVPVDVLIDLVCATKNAEIEALSKKIQELEKLLKAYNELDLTDEQKRKLQQMTKQIMNEESDVSEVGNTAESSYGGDNSESTTYGVYVEQRDTQTEGCTDNTCTQTAANVENLGAINIDFNIDGSAELEIDLEPICDPGCQSAIPISSGGSTDLKSLLAQRDREIAILKEEIIDLKSKLSGVKQTSTHSQLALASAQQEKALLAKAITSSKAPELKELEEEIACLRSNPNLTPEQETIIIKKELDVLKRYCDQLSNIQEENDQLKLENDYLKAQFGDGGDIQALQQRAAMLDNVTCERDCLRNEVERLAGGMEILRKKSDAAEQLEKEKSKLQKELNELNKARRQSNYDLELVQSENYDFQKTLETMRCERDGLREKLAANESAYNELQRQVMQLQTTHQNSEQGCLRLQDELNRLRIKAKESDVFRLERDRLQLRVEELSALEVEVLTLVEKVKKLSIERDVLKRQGCELHNIIADQEHEIKALLLHVDRLSQCVETQQDKIRTALDELQGELEHKNFLLTNSHEQLQNESQQRLSQAQIENDLRKTISELKNELNEKEAKIRLLEQNDQLTKCSAFDDDDDINALKEENRRLHERIQQLECACAHRHVDEILETSKQAVEVVIDEIKNKRSQSANNDYDNYMLEENKQLRKNSKDIQNLATERIDQLTNQLQQATKKIDELRMENEKLKSATKGIETDLKIYNSQLEEPIPSSESNSQLLAELKKCRLANENLEMRLKNLQGEDKNTQTCTCEELKKELERYRETSTQIDVKMTNHQVQKNQDVNNKSTYISNELREELERCRETNTEIDVTMTNLNRVQDVEESQSINDLQTKLELCRDANMQLQSTIKDLREKANTRVNFSEDVGIMVEEQLEVEMSVRKQFQEENCSLKGMLSTLQKENQRLQATIELRDLSITKIQTDIQSTGSHGLKDENVKLLKEIDQLKDIIQTMEKLKQPIEMTVNTFSDIKNQHKCTASVDYIIEENENLKKRIVALQNELQLVKKTTTTATAAVTAATVTETAATFTSRPNVNVSDVCSLSVCALKAEVKRLRDLLNAKDGGSRCECTILKNENMKLKNQITEMQEELDSFRKSVTKYIPAQSVRSSPGSSMATTFANSRISSKTGETLQLPTSTIGSCSASSPVKSRNATSPTGSCSASYPTRSGSPQRSDQQLVESMQLQIQNSNDTSLALMPASSTARNLPPATNEQLMIENVRLQAQMEDLKVELYKFTCLITGCESDSNVNNLFKINEDLTEQVKLLKEQILKLSGLKLGSRSPSQSFKRDGSEQTALCSRVQLLQEEIQRLKSYQEDDSLEVEHLKKIIVQQECDVDKFRSENIRLQRALQECEAMICLPADEQVSQTISKLKKEISDLKCENQCLRACLNSTSPADERSAISKLGSYTSNKDLRTEIEELRNQLECQRTCAASKNNEEEFEMLQNQNNILKKSIQNLHCENSSLCQEICKTKSEIEDLNCKLAESERAKCKLDGDLRNMQKEMSKRLADAGHDLQDKIRLLEEEKLRMKREQQELMERLEQSVNRCSAQESELEIEIRRLKNKIIQLENLNCSLQSDFIDCKEELEKNVKNRIKELEDKLRQAEDDRRHLEARLCQMTYEQDELAKKLEDKIREANEREIALESELMKLRGQIKSLEDENIDLEKQLGEARYALEKLEEEFKEKISRFEEQLEKLSTENQKLQQEKEQIASENNLLKSKIGDLESNFSELGDLNASNMQCKNQLDILQNQYSNCMEENKRLLEEIEKIKQEKIDMKKEISDLLDKLQICDVTLTDSNDKEQLEELVKKMELQLKNCDIKCKDTRQLDLELQRLLEENERLKKQCEEEKKALEAQFEKSLDLLKEQYDRDLEFVRGRHSEGIVRLQDMHEDTVSDTVKEYEREIENLQRQLADLMKQKQFDDETIKKQLEEIEKLRILAETEVDACKRECKELRTGIQSKLQNIEEENTRLKAELEIAKKCCEELDKGKQKLEEERNKLKSSLNDVTRTSMEEIIKMRTSVDNILQKDEAEMSKMKDYLKGLEGDLEKAKKDLENERNRLNDEINRLKAELEKGKKCCDELEKLTARLESSGRKSLFDNNQLQNENAKKNSQLDLLNAELANEKKRLGAEIDKLKEELEKAKKCCDELETIKKNLTMDNSDLESEVDMQRKKCLEELERLKKLHEMNEKKYEDLIAQLRAELADHKKCCDELEKLKRELDNQNKMVKGAGDAEQQYKEDLMKLQNELEKQRNQYELEIAKLRRELEDKKRLEDEIARLKQELATKQKCCDDLDKMKRELEASNSTLQKAYSTDTSKCEEELEKIKAELKSIRKQYEDEIAKLRKELDNCKSLVNDLQKQKEDLENANKGLKSQLDKAITDNANQLAKLSGDSDEAKKRLEDELARLKKELGAKQKCCDDLEALQKQLQSKNMELGSALASGNKDCEEELAKLKKEMENLRKKYDDELSKLKADLDSERKRAEEAMSKMRKELEDQKRRNDDLENLKKNLDKQLTNAQSKGDEGLENCLEELAKLKKDLERNKKRYEDEIENLKRELAEKAKCCDQLETMKKDLDKANKALQASKDEAGKRSTDDINNLKKDLDDTVKRYEDKLSKLKEEMAAERKKFEDEINKLKNELTKYKKCCDELDEVKLALQNEKMRLESEINKLKQDLQNEKNNRKRDVDDLNMELDKAKQCCKDLEATKKELENLMGRYEKDLEKLKKDYEDQLKRNANDLDECRKKLDELKKSYEAEIDQLKKEIKQKEKCCEELDSLKNNLLQDNGTIKKQYEDELNRLQSEINKGKKCCEDLEETKKQLAQAKKDCEDELKKLRDEIKTVTARLQEVENEKASLAAKLNEIQNEYNALKKDLANDQDMATRNKALEDCRDELLKEKKRCETEIAKLKEEIENLKNKVADYDNEINALKDLLKKGEKCCEELEKQKKDLKTEVDDFKDRRRNSRDSSTQQRPSTRDSTTQDIKTTRDSAILTSPLQEKEITTDTEDVKSQGSQELDSYELVSSLKVCPCGAIAKERGLKLASQRGMRLSQQQQMWPEPDTKRRKSSRNDSEIARKLDKLSKATALIVEVREGTHKFSLTKKSIVITNVEPSSLEVNKQIISLEEARPVNLTRSIESILSKALKVGLENLTHEELSGLHLKTKNAVSMYEPKMNNETCSTPSISESELALSKLPLQRRISHLENELSVRQECACQKMRELENKILTERQQMVEMKNRSVSEQRKLNWENDSLKQQASFHELRLQQLLTQIEQEKARSTSLRADLMKAKAIEAQLLEMIQQNRMQGQCSCEVESAGTIAKAKMMQRQSIVGTGSQEGKRRSSARNVTDKDLNLRSSRKSLTETSQDSSEGRGDEKKRRSSSKKGSRKK